MFGVEYKPPSDNPLSPFEQCLLTLMYIESNHVSLTENMTLFANEFLPVTVTFSEKWGLEYVLADLRFSINDVCINVGMPLISWPVIPYIDGNGLLQTPSVTDDFGQGI